jgi:hypothetical protein
MAAISADDERRSDARPQVSDVAGCNDDVVVGVRARGRLASLVRSDARKTAR